MRELKRPAAVFGFSLLLSLIALMILGQTAAFVIAPALSLLTAIFLFRRSNAARYLLAVTGCFVAASLLLTGADRLKYAPSLRCTGEDLHVTGTVADFPRSHPSSQSVILKNCAINGEQTRYSVRIYYTDGSFPHPGDEASLSVSELFSNADGHSRYFYHTLSTGTWLSAFCRGKLTVNESDKRTLSAGLAELRYRIRNKSAAFMTGDLAAVSSAIVTGDQSDIPDGIRDSFRMSGVSHLFAVSGMHLSLWTGVIFFVLRKRSRIRVLPNLFALLFIWLYAAFTGFSPSVLRAGIMLSLVCLGGIFRRHADPVNALGVSAMGLLLYNPWLAGNVSFLLSFTATFAIVGVFPALRDRPLYTGSLVSDKLLSVKEGLLLSVLILFFTVPCAAWFFGYATVLTPVTSLLCTPIAELMMGFSALGAALPAKLFLTRAVYTVAASLTNAIVLITEKASKMEFAIFPLREPYVAIWFIVSVAVLLLFRLRLRKSRVFTFNALLGVWCAALLTGILFTMLGANDFTVHIPDAGSAAMISIVSGTGRRSLILSCGGEYDAFRATRSYLQSRTAFTPEYVFLPRRGKQLEKQLPNVLKALPPEHLVMPSDADPIRGMPDDTVTCDSFDGDIWDNVRLSYENRPDLCAGRLMINGAKIVFCLYSSSDFTDADEAYRSGDYLICIGQIPDSLDTDLFTKVIVLSDRRAQTLGLPDNAVSTADSGAVSFTLRQQRSDKGGS